MIWEIKIKKVANGFIVKHMPEGEGEELVETIFEEKDENDEDIGFGKSLSELRCMEQLLWFVKEHFAVYYSKHNKKNIMIKIEENLE